MTTAAESRTINIRRIGEEKATIPARRPGKGLSAAMRLKTNGQTWTIQEQIIEDVPTGLTLQFQIVPEDSEAPYRLKISGDFPFGNREIMFGPDGNEARAAAVMAGLCEPTWLVSADEYPATD
ncbi:MAG TPA: hypothetical protein VHY91_22080 [Pirellulales bacterium]|nr:hypothetical protein [Pirellulales bacterium]